MILWFKPFNMDEDEEHMATVSKEIADDIVAGKYESDGWVKIVEYTNIAGDLAYGCVHRSDDPNRYRENPPFVNKPRLYWESK